MYDIHTCIHAYMHTCIHAYIDYIMIVISKYVPKLWIDVRKEACINHILFVF
jgi:hypothetical protein